MVARSRPQLLIPLGSEEEVPSTRAAIQFAYTGRVVADSIRVALEVRRQGTYLQVYDCAAACDELLIRLLTGGQAGPSDAVGCEARGDSARGSGVAGSKSRLHAVLELYNFERLWPPLPEFNAVVDCACGSLAAHFGSALATLNTPSLLKQLLDLESRVLGDLLSCNTFATDSESSVLLLLATWMAANYAKTTADDRHGLLDTIRLVQLSRTYATFILPALAADYCDNPEEAHGWLPIKLMDAIFISSIASSKLEERDVLLDLGLKQDSSLSPTAYDPRARPRCGRLDAKWHIRLQRLQKAYDNLQPGQTVHVYGTFSCNKDRWFMAGGFRWSISVKITHGQPTAVGLCLWCTLPHALALPNSRLKRKSACRMAVPAVNLFLQRWGHGRKFPEILSLDSCVEVGNCISTDLLLKQAQQLPPAQPQVRPAPPQPAPAAAPQLEPGAASNLAPSGAGADLTAAWADYLRDGFITGFMRLDE